MIVSAWLLSIVGVTVVGVLVELLLTDSPMSKFVRSIYTFFILFVIIQPLPSFFKTASFNLLSGEVPINTALVQEINHQTKTELGRRAQETLAQNGFDNCIVTYHDNGVYINAHNSTRKDIESIINIVMAVMGVPASAVEVFI